MMRAKRAAWMLAAGGAALAGCHRARQAASAESVVPASAPVIDTVEPESVSVRPGDVVEVVLRGRGFAPGREPGRNDVHLGSQLIAHVPANDSGTEVRFVVPSMVTSGEAPPRPIWPGAYKIVITTPTGTSNPVTLRIAP